MRLRSRDGGDVFELEVYDYQFPDAEDPELRYSWHQVRGFARHDGQEWKFAWPVLTCEETPQVSAWLRATADSAAAAPEHALPVPALLNFTESNVTFTVISVDNGLARLRIALSQEFRRPPWTTPPSAETVLVLTVTPGDLRAAADSWDTASALFPDGLA